MGFIGTSVQYEGEQAQTDPVRAWEESLIKNRQVCAVHCQVLCVAMRRRGLRPD